MSNDNEQLKPLSFENNYGDLPPLNLDNANSNHDEFVPITGASKTEIKNKNSNFVCLFGSASSGKSVILSSLLYYLRARAGVLRPTPDTPNSKEAQKLLSQFLDDISRGVLPARTTKDQVTRFDLVFEPNNKSKKVNPINLTFLETAGDNNYEIRHGGKFHSSLEDYLDANIPLTFIIVTSYENAHKEDTFINEFIDELEKKGNNIKSINIIVVISKWDKSGKGYATNEEIENFISERLPMTDNMVDAHNLSRTYYTIGNVKIENGQEKIAKLNLDTAEVLGKWLYESITGYSLDYEGTFWERIKFSIFK
jgi:hypothetical protein